MKEHILKKKQKLRNNEYYGMQDTLDTLYDSANKGKNFKNLMKYITCENNILLAYRNIKNNKGSNTIGTDNLNIEYYKNMKRDKFVKYIQNKIENYTPKSVRRVEIPKPNGKTRPLGIPCMEDRIIQQCIKQILEPICESKFHKHSYGFRPNRSSHNAIARSMMLMNINKLHYVVDVDIKSFFDNVNHSKLKKQLWHLGIQDKNLLAIIGKILKSPIQDIGIPTKGTPQGGILSPLLSNVVLNELDWWISSQWETFEPKHKYTFANKYPPLRKTNLKEIFIVRYADDFKIFCRNYKTAQKINNATKLWLKDRLELVISTEKSKITNLRKNYTEFLGFKLKVKPKKNKYVVKSRMCDKARKMTIDKYREQVRKIQKNINCNNVNQLNAMILGSHNYYRIATHIYLDFKEINFLVNRTLDIRLKSHISDKPNISNVYKNLYGKYNGKIRTISNITIFPIYGCKTKPPLNFTQQICNYTKEGRKIIHGKLNGYNMIIEYYLKHGIRNQTTEFSDNSISLIAGQLGNCFVTGKMLEIGNMECHHKIPKYLGGTDKYENLVWLKKDVHKLVHSTVQETINKYLGLLSLNKKGLKKVNSLRMLVGNSEI